MQVEPDAREAVGDRVRLLERMGSVLDRAELRAPGDGVLRDPAAVELVHSVQRALRSGPLPPGRRRALEREFARLPSAGFGAAQPRDHLRRSLARAMRSVPARADGERPAAAEVVGWRESEREALAAALELLTVTWPESAAEVRESVVEIALLDGDAIDGFTDFAVHGAVLIHRARLRANAAGLPGPVRFAEALVHEGAHTSCNAAAAADPFLVPERPAAGADAPAELLVPTPLRADPRPLSGLFQQTVVLARSVLLYGRLAGSALGGGAPAVDARRERLLTQGRQAVGTLGAHTAALTEHGNRVLSQCGAVFANG
ncbi:HEXXH motif domain-containing protein [Kitasatospora mediocidica]|uniref:HEXXH motif domain-containing protein n=1 Tax=Kitasatospora mediocidica TaxID=58352 RepID=UPI00056AE46D|nr:HEXXH motif domain-containing protein [Kitasatospora mediocidica]